MVLNDQQQATLSESISGQKTGIVIEWSKYTSPNTEDYDYNYIFIPKNAEQGKRITFCLNSYDIGIGKKSIWIDGNIISGAAANGIEQNVGGINYNNGRYAIRRVLGV